MNAVALDLFAGTGWSVACKRLGIMDHGVELMPEARGTREAAGFSTIFEDVWAGLADPGLLGLWTGPRRLFIASPPCQSFSIAGSGSGRKALEDVFRLIDEQAYKLPGDGLWQRARENGLDDRTALVLTPLAYVWKHRPEFVALEQVPTVLPVWEAVARELRAFGYSVDYRCLQAEQFGVPQTRKRAILVARNDGHEAALPIPTHSKYYPRDPQRLDPGVKPWVSMAEALGFGLRDRPAPTVTGGGTETGGAEPIAKLARYTGRPDWEPRALQSQYTGSGGPDSRGERHVGEPATTITSKALSMRWLPERLIGNQKPPGTDEYHSRSTAAPAQTLTAQSHLFKFSEPRPELEEWQWFDHPATTVAGDPRITAREHHHHGEQSKTSLRLTQQEAAILQTFPADFPFQGTKGKRFLQIGNAVPPLFAEAILRTLIHNPDESTG